MTILLVLLGAVLIQYLAGVYYKKNWDRQLRMTLHFEETAVTEGEGGTLTEIIENRKWLFLPMLQAGFMVNRNLSFSEEENASVSDNTYKRDIFSVMSWQRIIRQVSFSALKRGYYEITQTELFTKGPLMSGELYSTCPVSTYLYVYPKKESGQNFAELFQKLSGVLEERKRLLEDPFTFRGIREYAPGDPMNRINWKASARTGTYMVNMQDSTTAGKVWLLLDVEDETIWKYEELHETGIRIAAALAEEFLGRGIETGVICNGRDCVSGEEICVPARAGKGQSTRILQSLSRMDLNKAPGKFSQCLAARKNGLLSEEAFCILITRNQYEELVLAMEELGRKNQGCVFLAALYPEMELKVRNSRTMQVIRWEVKKG